MNMPDKQFYSVIDSFTFSATYMRRIFIFVYESLIDHADGSDDEEIAL